MTPSGRFVVLIALVAAVPALVVETIVTRNEPAIEPSSVITDAPGDSVRLRVIDSGTARPVANKAIEIWTNPRGVLCSQAPCATDEWNGHTDAAGQAMVPARVLRTVVGIQVPGRGWGSDVNPDPDGRGWVVAIRRGMFANWPTGVRVVAQRGLVGEWRLSRWTLCTPIASLPSGSVDAPLEELIFNADGTFSVTWTPFETYKDYWGRYTSNDSTHAIALHIEQGNFIPADFSGTGTFAVDGNQLTLRGVRLGTKTATNRPKLCELTFARL